MKFFKVLKDWIIAHKVVSIIIAAALVVAIALAITLPIVLSNKHDFSTEWSHDNENHWHACVDEDCDEVQDKAAHVYDNACDTDCNICGATRTPEHNYDNNCDAVCNDCGATRTPYDHVYDGEADTTCSVCGHVRDLPVRNQATDEQEWNKTFDLRSMLRFRVDVSYGAQRMDVTRNGDIIHMVGYYIDGEEETKVYERYVIKDGDSYYRIDWNSTAEPPYTKKTLTSEEYDDYFLEFTYMVNGGLSFEDAEYDADGKSYKNADGSTNIALTYVGGEITSIKSSSTLPDDPDESYDSETVFEADDIMLPEVHTLSTTPSYDEAGHWYACTDEGCEYKTTVKEHEYDGKYDADCNICGAIRTVEAHEHNWSSAWAADDKYHWHPCTAEGCSETKDKAEHVYDNACDAYCNDCGAIRIPDDHVYDNACDTDCNVCGAVRTVGPHPGSDWNWDDSGHWMECTECHTVLNTVEEHTKSDKQVYDETQHWYKCSRDGCGYKFEAAAHEMNGDQTDTHHWQACDYCDYETEHEEHEWNGEYASSHLDHSYICSICEGHYLSGDHVKKWYSDETGHWSECEVCLRELDAKQAHTQSTDQDFDETQHWYKCTQEGCPYKFETANHDPRWNFDEGYHWYICEYCDIESLSEKEAHDGSDKYKVAGDEHYHVCSICTDIYGAEKHTKLWQNDATNHWSTCEICKTKLDLEEPHTKSSTYESDPNGHWHVCANENCTHIYYDEDYEAHTEKWITKDTTHKCVCETCGYVIVEEAAHTMSETYSYDDSTGHYKTCTVEGCTYKSSTTKHMIVGISCSVCGYTKSIGTLKHLYIEDRRRKR